MTSMPYEPIIVQTNRFGAPGRFLWQGRAYTIDAIDRIWRRPHGAERGRRVYKVRSRGKTFLLQFDQRLQRWTILRAPWRTRLGLAVERLAARIST